MMFNELLGPQSMRFFCIGILAAAFSSLFVNPLIGGTVLADGLGKDCRVSGNWTKAATSAGMLLGMVVAILGSMGKMETLPLILNSTSDYRGWRSIYRLGYAQAYQRGELWHSLLKIGWSCLVITFGSNRIIRSDDFDPV